MSGPQDTTPDRAAAIATELSDEAMEILATIVAQTDEDDRTDTPAVVEQTPYSRQRVHYHFDTYLSKYELIKTNQPVGGPGEFPPKQVWPTDKGRAIVDEHRPEERDEKRSVQERLDRLAATIDQIESRIGALEDTSESGVQDDELAGLREDVTQLEQTVAELQRAPVLRDEDVREAMDAGTVWASVCKDLLIEEYGRDELARRFKERRSEIPLLSTAKQS